MLWPDQEVLGPPIGYTRLRMGERAHCGASNHAMYTTESRNCAVPCVLCAPLQQFLPAEATPLYIAVSGSGTPEGPDAGGH